MASVTLRERLAGQLSVRLGFRVRAPEIEDAKGFQRSGYRDDHMRWQSEVHGIVSHSTMSDCIEYGFSIAEHDTPRGKRYEVQAKDPPRLKGEDRMIALVESLPAAGAIVVVHSGAVRDFYRSTIVRLRGAEAGKRVHVRVVRDRSSAFEGLVGGRARVFCDAGFVENARPALKSYVETLIAAIHVAIPPGMDVRPDAPGAQGEIHWR